VKILVLSHRHWYYVAHGIERFLPMSRHLAQKGHEVTMMYLPVPSLDYSLVHDNYRIDLDSPVCMAMDKTDRCRALFIPDLRSRRSIVNRLGPHARAANDFLRSLQEVAVGASCLLADYDLVHIEYLFDSPLVFSGLLSRSLKRVPHIIDFVDLVGPLIKPSKYYKLLSRIGYLPTWTTVCSEYLRSCLIGKGFPRDTVFKIPMGADLKKVRLVGKEQARKELGLSQDQRFVGFELAPWGIHDEYVDVLLRSFGKILDHLAGVKMLFIGSTIHPPLDRIHQKISAAGLDRNVVCTGLLRTDELSLWLGACDVLVLPLRDVPYDHAKFPGRVGDYLAAGRPIVAAAVGEMQEIVSKGCGLLARPGDPQDFASKILSVLKHDELMREMGEKSRHLAENEYSWESVADRLETVYQEVIDAH